MVEAAQLRELEANLSSLKTKKAQLDSEAMRHELELKNAKASLEGSVAELKELGFSTIAEADSFLESAVEELNRLLEAANKKIDGIVTE